MLGRKRYVVRRNQQTGELETVERKSTPRTKHLHIMPDLPPYKAVSGDMAGKEVSGRKQHREFLKRNGFMEVGNEHKAMTEHGGKSSDNPWVDGSHADGLEEAVGKAWRDLDYGG